MAIFSNLIDNMILVGYIAIEVFFDWVNAIKEKQKWKLFIKEHGVHWIIILCWCVCAIFEMLGGRAAMAGEIDNSFGKNVVQTISNFMVRIKSMHKMFIIFAAAVIGIAVLLMVLEKRNKKHLDVFQMISKLLSLIVLLTVYSVLITSKVEANYIARSEYVFGIFFYVLLLLVVCFSYLMKKIERTIIIVPLMLCILLSFVNTNTKTFKEPNQFGISGDLCHRISHDLVQKVISADEAGELKVELEVSNSGGANNWPQAIYMGERISAALYKHGVTNRKVEITLIPSTEYNERYNLYQ